MLRRRVIVCLDVDADRVVKGTRFRGLRDQGGAVELARRYQQDGADEIVFLDISASGECRGTVLDTVRRTAEHLFIPLTVGGGVAGLTDVERLLRAGADKVAINTAAVQEPDLIARAAARFGSQCITASIDALREPGATSTAPARYAVYTHGGRTRTALEAADWASRCATLGAGEILVTSIDRDGGRHGYDLVLTRAVTRAVSVPGIASGGAGHADHLRDAFCIAHADAALAAGIFHDHTTSITRVKQALHAAGIPVRLPEERGS
jgi:imidazole glycerol-phosphate synthase subunit HisF